MYRIGLKLWSTNTQNYLNEARRLHDDGVYDYIELYVVPDTLDSLKSWRTLDIPFVIHNAHFAHGFNLAKADMEQNNIRIYEQTRLFADTLKAKYIIFHGGIDGEAEQTARQLAALNEPRALIESKSFVALSNRMGGKFCRGATLDELTAILEQAGCGFCLDFGHAVCSASSQGLDPYAFIRELLRLSPSMYHLSDVTDMNSPYDAHPHLGTGQLDIARLKADMLPAGAMISVETNKNYPDRLDDFIEDVRCLKDSC